MLDHIEQIVLLQPDQLVSLCKSLLGDSPSTVEIRRLQKLVTAVARISLRQRMQLVFAGYRIRFAKIGVIIPGTVISLYDKCMG